MNGAGGRLAGSVSWGIAVQVFTQCVPVAAELPSARAGLVATSPDSAVVVVATIAVRLVGCTEPTFRWGELGGGVRAGAAGAHPGGVNRPCRSSR